MVKLVSPSTIGDMPLSPRALSFLVALTLTCLVFSTRPWPEQVPQYSSTTTPAPRQVGQVVWVWKAPSGVRVAWMTTPEPPHWPQVLDFAPGLTPLPVHVVQDSKWRMRTLEDTRCARVDFFSFFFSPSCVASLQTSEYILHHPTAVVAIDSRLTTTQNQANDKPR